jgi:hypothetical protein
MQLSIFVSNGQVTMIWAFVGIVILIALLVCINHFETHRYRLDFSPSQLQALRIFVSETDKDMRALSRLGLARDMSALSSVYFQQRLTFVWKLRDHLKRHAWVSLPERKFAMLAWMISNYVTCVQGGLPRNAETKLLENILQNMVAVGPKTGPFSVQLAINHARQSIVDQNPEA